MHSAGCMSTQCVSLDCGPHRSGSGNVVMTALTALISSGVWCVVQNEMNALSLFFSRCLQFSVFRLAAREKENAKMRKRQIEGRRKHRRQNLHMTGKTGDCRL